MIAYKNAPGDSRCTFQTTNQRSHVQGISHVYYITFRKTRKKLADDNRPLKYARYAIGEIALVVIGILIALQINNWNENRVKDKSLKGHLRSLNQAINHDIRELSISMEFNEFRFDSWKYLLRMSGIPVDSLRDIPKSNIYIVNVWNKPYPDEINKDFIDTSIKQINGTFLDNISEKI